MHHASSWRKALRDLTSPSGWQDVLPEYVFYRGVEYADEGRVVSWALKDGVICGVVRGAADYRVLLNVDDVERSRCSCPYGRPCKHVVAVAVHVARETRLDGIRQGQPLDLDALLGAVGDGEWPAYVADVMASRPDVSLLVRATRFVHTAPARWADGVSLSKLEEEARALLLAADQVAQGDTLISASRDEPHSVTVTYTDAGWESARRLVQGFADALARHAPAPLAPYAVYEYRRLVARLGDDVRAMPSFATGRSFAPWVSRSRLRSSGSAVSAGRRWPRGARGPWPSSPKRRAPKRRSSRSPHCRADGWTRTICRPPASESSHSTTSRARQAWTAACPTCPGFHGRSPRSSRRTGAR
ncbi:SWIM zinc finger family protein [Alicyclobacillus sendaiensis]|uniref:SWIM zinc finger family protein n=1 Tax=Alicyclobacillus sendaiensis TaxID=192387 RepID=UPI000A59D640|nr:SWIM zinc finger family protein [Alicyclobacillus sendaiensis]